MYVAPTKNQAEFISDIESGLAALKQQGIRIQTLTQVMEAAGRDITEFSHYVNRLQGQNCWDVIMKLRDTLHSAGLKVPVSISRVLEYMPGEYVTPSIESDSPALKLRRETFPHPIQKEAEKPQIEIDLKHGSIDIKCVNPNRVRENIIDLLDTLPKTQQVRIIDTVARWFGVGT